MIIHTYFPSSLMRHHHFNVPEAPQVHFALNESTILFPNISSWVAHLSETDHHEPKYERWKTGCFLGSAFSLLFPIHSLFEMARGSVSSSLSILLLPLAPMPVGGLCMHALLKPGSTTRPALAKHGVSPLGRTFDSQFVPHYIYFCLCYSS